MRNHSNLEWFEYETLIIQIKNSLFEFESYEIQTKRLVNNCWVNDSATIVVEQQWDKQGTTINNNTI